MDVIDLKVVVLWRIRRAVKKYKFPSHCVAALPQFEEFEITRNQSALPRNVEKRKLNFKRFYVLYLASRIRVCLLFRLIKQRYISRIITCLLVCC